MDIIPIRYYQPTAASPPRLAEWLQWLDFGGAAGAGWWRVCLMEAT